MTRIGAASVLQRITSAMPTWEAQGDEAGVALRCGCRARSRSPHSTSPVSSFPLSSPIGDHHLCSVELRRIVPPQRVWGTKLEAVQRLIQSQPWSRSAILYSTVPKRLCRDISSKDGREFHHSTSLCEPARTGQMPFDGRENAHEIEVMYEYITTRYPWRCRDQGVLTVKPLPCAGAVSPSTCDMTRGLSFTVSVSCIPDQVFVPYVI
ncbi:hypothetical protein J3F84DRAFT_127298 [Trichoderma pleuroticola]